MSPLEKGTLWTCGVGVVVICATLGTCSPAHGAAPATATLQAQESTATVSIKRTVCPNKVQVGSTMSQSIYNRSGYPLWRIICVYDSAKR